MIWCFPKLKITRPVIAKTSASRQSASQINLSQIKFFDTVFNIYDLKCFKINIRT